MIITRITGIMTQDDCRKHLAWARQRWEVLKPQPGRQTVAKEMALKLIADHRYVCAPDPGGMEAGNMEIKVSQAQLLHWADAAEVERVEQMSDAEFHDWNEKGGRSNYPIYRA